MMTTSRGGFMLRNTDERKKKCLSLMTAFELMRQACGDTCDFCPIVVECERYFRVEPREWEDADRNPE